MAVETSPDPLRELPDRAIVYVYAVVDADGQHRVDPVVAWRTAEEARAAAVSYVADRAVSSDEADDLLDWQESTWTRDGRYPTFTADIKHGAEVRVWPIEVMSDAARRRPGPR